VPDAVALNAFAGFMLAVLPRLLLYPGGLFAGICIAVLALVLPRISRAAAPPAPTYAASGGAVLVALALAWTAWALLPLPGTTPLPGAPDLLTPLGLLLGAGLLSRAPSLDAVGWRREACGRPLLLAAPLVALAAPSPASLMPALVSSAAASVDPARALAGLAYVAGFCICYAAPGSAPWTRPAGPIGRVAAWLEWLGWLGIGAALGPAGAAAAGPPAWSGVVLVAVLAAIAAGALTTPFARTLATRAAPWGWAALGLSLLAVLLAP